SPGHAATWDFLDRRIDGVMQIEKVKADLKANRLTAALMAGPMAVLGTIRAPKRRGGMPGRTG
ncbi:MAG: COQ9 family protein, partial [Pseudooceanicola nanhaiensis]